jgi:hypothetical protein
MKKIILTFFLLFLCFVVANEMPSHAQGLREILITVTTADNKD